MGRGVVKGRGKGMDEAWLFCFALIVSAQQSGRLGQGWLEKGRMQQLGKLEESGWTVGGRGSLGESGNEVLDLRVAPHFAGLLFFHRINISAGQCRSQALRQPFMSTPPLLSPPTLPQLHQRPPCPLLPSRCANTLSCILMPHTGDAVDQCSRVVASAGVPRQASQSASGRREGLGTKPSVPRMAASAGVPRQAPQVVAGRTEGLVETPEQAPPSAAGRREGSENRTVKAKNNCQYWPAKTGISGCCR